MTNVLRFAVVGAVGFGVDAGVLWFLTAQLSVGPLVARLFSFTVAVVCTWLGNTMYAFRESGDRKLSLPGFVSYVSMQSLGVSVNLAVYTACIRINLPPVSTPIFALAAASGCAMAINYLLLSRLHFSQKDNKKSRYIRKVFVVLGIAIGGAMVFLSVAQSRA